MKILSRVLLCLVYSGWMLAAGCAHDHDHDHDDHDHDHCKTCQMEHCCKPCDEDHFCDKCVNSKCSKGTTPDKSGMQKTKETLELMEKVPTSVPSKPSIPGIP